MEGLKTRLGNIRMVTPLVAVSGIYGLDYEALVPSKHYIGAVITKSVTLKPRAGNPEPRIVETRAGLLNAIGLQNPGIETFLKEEIPKLRAIEVPVIVSVAGSTVKEYVKCSSAVAERDEILGIELNVSCPNVEMGGMEFGTDAAMLERLVARVSRVIDGKFLIVKLTPNVTDIAAMAKAAIDGGANAISLINTLRGMAIDKVTQKPKLGNRVGGLSGIGIHPVAVYMIRQCYISCCRRANIPIIGVGGVYDGDEALEFLLAGATCVGIGTALFRDERRKGEASVFERVALGIDQYLQSRHESSVTSLIGKAAPEQLLAFEEIGELLGVREETARSLGKRGVLPGCPSGGRWEATLDDIEGWYAQLSGQQWADLVADGRLDAIVVEVDLNRSVSSETVLGILRRWEGKGIADVIKASANSDGAVVADLKLQGTVAQNRKAVAGLSVGDVSPEVTRRRVMIKPPVAFQSRLDLATTTTALSVSPKGLLRMGIREDLRELPQREREIVRSFIASYAKRLVSEIRESVNS